MTPVSGEYDVVVIGGSFAGLAATIQLGRTRRRVLLVDAGSTRNRFAHASHGFLGQDGRTPREIVAKGRSEIAAYRTVETLDGEVVRARGSSDGFVLALASGDEIAARRIVLATGIVDELPKIPGLEERWGRSVLHCPYCHGFEVADQRLGVLATSDASMHQAQLIPDWSGDVTFFVNGTFTPDEAQREALLRRGVRVELRTVEALLGDAPALAGVQLADGTTVPLDALFTTSRTRMASPLAEQLGCAFDDGPFGPVIRTGPRKETTVPGVFAAGDAARTPHNATWAAADGVMAGTAAHQSLIFTAPH